MSARGGAGGRRLPVFIDLTLTGQQQVIAGLNTVARAYQQVMRGAAGASGPVNQTAQATANAARQMTLFGRVAQQGSRALASATGPLFAYRDAITQSTRQTTLFESTLRSSAQGVRTFSATLAPLSAQATQTAAAIQRMGAVSVSASSSIRSVSTATEATVGGMSRFRAAIGAAREEARGLAFASIGMFGAVNEAAFMMENAAMSGQRLAEAQAEVTRLEEAGAEGTQEYTRAVQELEKAQRAQTFTMRIASQSFFDIISFSALAATQVGGLISSYRKHRGETAALTAANAKLAAANGVVAVSNEAVAFSSRQAAIGTVAANAAAMSSTGRLAQLSGALTNTALGFGAITTAASGIRGVLTTVGARLTALVGSALAATGIFTGLAARMGNTGAQITRMGTSAAAGGGALTTIATGGMAAATGITAMLGPLAILIAALTGAALSVAAFHKNVGGFKDTLRGWREGFDEFFGVSEEFRAQTNALEDQMGAFITSILEGIPGIGEWVKSWDPAIEAEKKAAQASEEMVEKITQLNNELNNSKAIIGGYGQSWETVAAGANQFIAEIAGSFKQFGSGIEQEIVRIQQAMSTSLQIDPTGGLYKFFESQRNTIRQFESDIRTTFVSIRNAATTSGVDIQQAWDALSVTFGRIPDAMIGLPDHFKTAVEQMSSVIDSAMENNKLTSEQWGQIWTDMVDGHITPANRALIQSLDGGSAALKTWETNINSASIQTLNGQQAIVALDQRVAHAGLTFEEAAAQADALTAGLAFQTQLMASNAQQSAALGEGLRTLTEESEGALRVNTQIINESKKLGQTFNENAVATAAQAAGIQVWRESLAQAYFNIVETATALGYMGDVSTESAVKMLEFTAAEEAANEANAKGVETFFQLGDAAKTALAQLQIYPQTLADVALGYQDLTERQALAIELAAHYDSTLATNVEGMKELIDHGYTIAEVIDMDNQTIAEHLSLLEQSGAGYKVTAEESMKWLQSMLELPPALQQIAQAMGILNIEGQKLEPWMQRSADYLQQLGSEFTKTEDEARQFAIAQGVDVVTAMKATGPALTDLIIGLEDLEETQLNAAEAAQESAQKFADAWMQSFEQITSAQQEWSNTMSSAMDKMGEEFGEEMEVGLSDIEKKIAKGAQAFSKQFAEEIFPEDFLATALIEGNDPGDIIKELQDLWDDVVDEDIITEAEAAEIFTPLLDFMQDDLPKDAEQAFGYLVGRMPHLMDKISPVIVNGIKVAGGEARAFMRSNLVNPLIEELNALETGMSGVDVGRGLLTSVQELMPRLEQEFPRIAGLMQQTLDNTSLTTDQKVQEIIGYLEQIDPAFASMIMAIDQDADQIPDIIDESILSPMEQMQIGILSAMQTYHQAMADTLRSLGDPQWQFHADLAERIGQNINDIATAADNASGPIATLAGNVLTYNTHTGNTGQLTEDFKNELLKLEPAEREARIQAYELATGIDILGFGLSEEQLHAHAAGQGIDTIKSAAGNAVGPVRDLDKAMRDTAVAFKEFSMIGGGGGKAGVDVGAGAGAEAEAGVTLRTKPEAPIPDFPKAVAAWTDFRDDVYIIMQTMIADSVNAIATIELAWTNQMSNNGAQIQAFITGPLTTLSTAYQLYATNVPTILASMELAWTMHLANNGAQIQAFITGPLTQLAGAYTLYQTNVVPILQAMELAWTMHLANNGAQIQAFIAGPLMQLGAAYGIYNATVVPIIQSMELAWTNHINNSTAQILAFVNTLALYLENYITMQTLVPQIIGQMETAWTNHIANNSTQISNFISGPLNGLINTYPIISQAVHEALESANQNWAAHVNHVSGLIDEMIDHVEELADAIAQSMSDIADSMGEAEQAAVDLKAAIDALEDKTITITTVYRTTGSRTNRGSREGAQHGFEGIVRQPTRFIVGEGNQPEFVSVTPLVGRNARGNDQVRRFFDSLETENNKRKRLERAGSGGLGSSKSGGKSVPVTPTSSKDSTINDDDNYSTAGPENSGLKRPDIRPASERRKTTLNAFHREVLTYGEQQEYEKLLKKLKKKKWKPSKLSDKDEERLYEIEEKFLQAMIDQIEAIKQAMEQIIPQINQVTDLRSEEELEKWVSTVIPPISAVPLSMHYSSVKAMPIRGRYEHHRQALKQGRVAQLDWAEQEYERQQRVIQEAEERRLRLEKEKEDWLLEHGTKKQKKAIKKKREKEAKEKRRRMYLAAGARKGYAYQWSAQKYYESLAHEVEEPTRIPVQPVDSGVSDNDSSVMPDMRGKRGLSTIVRNRTRFTAGEFGKAERVNITPVGEEVKSIAEEVRQEVRHFITGRLAGLGIDPDGGGGSSKQRQVIYLSVNQPVELKINESVIANAVNKSFSKIMSGKR